jgi:hypothetical protein
MGLTNWMGTFGRAQSLDLSSDLERGYEAALLIQSIEMEHYNDRPVRPELELSIPRAMQAQLIRRFRAALQVCRQCRQALAPYRKELSGQELRQFQLIDTVTGRYAVAREELPALSRSPEMLPRSLVNVVDSVRRQLDPEAEATVVAGFRRRRDSTLVSLRILLLLILVPVLVQQLSRTYVIEPVLDKFAINQSFLSQPRPHMAEEAAERLRTYRSQLEFDALLTGLPLPTAGELREKLATRAIQLNDEALGQSSQALKNVIADGFGLFGFLLVCLLGRQELRVLRGFLDEVIYGLSDSAKAFAIILFTDIFVGFHSPEGWTVLLGGIANHFGLPEQENFVLLFIATFPVILATVFKYWIFRYLNRVSPSSVATLRNMNGGG